MNKTIRILTAVSLAAFTVTVLSVLGALTIIYQRDRQSQASELNIPATGSAGLATVREIELSVSEVALHKSAANCWIIISGNVYDLTPFLTLHPGGAGVMSIFCGKDGTAAFNSKNKKPAVKHSQTAASMLPKYLLGSLGSKITADQVANGNPVTTPTGVSDALTGGNSNSAFLNQNKSAGNTLSAGLVATHNTISNCWIIISGNTYNVTPYLSVHPGGLAVITPFCGRDATNAFATKGKNPGNSHSVSARNILNSYLIGSIGSTVTAQTGSNQLAAADNTPIPTSPPQNTGQILTTSEVALHNTSANCWLLISNNVYNVTNYLTSHPGGVSVITPYCGKDATNAFATRGGNGNHSNNAQNLLNNYLIGALGSASVGSIAGGTSDTGSSVTNTPLPQNGSNNSLPASVTAKYPGATVKKQDIEDDGKQELEIIYNGSCRKLKISAAGSVTEDEQC